MFKLIRDQTSIGDVLSNRGLWPVSYSAYYTENNQPAAIFVMHSSPSPDVFADSFSCVVSAIQMTDLPATAPELGSPFYRVSSFTKLFQDAVSAVAFDEKIKALTQDLVNNLYAAGQLSEVQNTVFEPLGGGGTDVPAPSSGSDPGSVGSESDSGSGSDPGSVGSESDSGSGSDPGSVGSESDSGSGSDSGSFGSTSG
jgi:hypothetical protein